jgi:hypothetical protein
MRFRVTHLLAAVGFVAISAAALANANSLWSSLIQLLAWFLYAALGVRAVVRDGRERMVLISALIFGPSFLLLSYWISAELPTYKLLIYIRRGVGAGTRWQDFRTIGDIIFSLLFALVGGALGAYWSRSRSSAS